MQLDDHSQAFSAYFYLARGKNNTENASLPNCKQGCAATGTTTIMSNSCYVCVGNSNNKKRLIFFNFYKISATMQFIRPIDF